MVLFAHGVVELTITNSDSKLQYLVECELQLILQQDIICNNCRIGSHIVNPLEQVYICGTGQVSHYFSYRRYIFM